MIATEHTAKICSPRTSRFALLGALLRANGTGAPACALQGAPARRRARVSLLASLCALTAALALSTAPALAVRGHVFSTTFGEPGSGAGQLSEPWGVAVEEAGPNAGDVYVADFGNNRVQWFSYNAVAEKYEVAGEVKAATGSGTGTLTVGSQTIESVASTTGAFVVGQSISGVGVGKEAEIPAETTVTAVNPVAGTIEISKAVEGKVGAVETLVPLSAEQPLFKPRAVAVDNSTGGESSGDVYVSSGQFPSVVDKFTASGEFVGQIARTIPEAPAFEFVSGVAVDPAGRLWVMEEHGGPVSVDHFNSAVANGFEHSCHAPENSSVGLPEAGFGLAVDAKDNLYVVTNRTQARGEGGVVELDSECKVINNALDTESDPSAAAAGVTFFGVAVESSSGEAYVDNVESVGRFATSGGHEVEVERFGTGHLAGEACNGFVKVTCLGGLAVNGAAAGATAGAVYAAVGSPARIVVFTPEEPVAPTVESESVVKLTDNSVTLQAEIDPRSLPAEAATKYYFEYGPCSGDPGTCKMSAYGSSTATGSLSPSFDVETVGAPLEGLIPGTTYHFKVVAENKRGGPVVGAERVFTMRNTGEFVLADGRGWEMVSPAAMHGALILPLGQGSGSTGAGTQAAAGSGALAFVANAPTESKPAGSASSPQVLSTRGAGGWSSQNVVVPHAVSTGVVSIAVEVPFFSEDLSLAAVQPLGSFVALSEAASEQTAYLRDNTAGAYTPLVTGCPEAPAPCKPAIEAHADVLPGTVFGNQSTIEGKPCPPEKAFCGAQFVGGTPDLKHVVLTAWTSLKPGANSKALYEWNAGGPASEQLQLVSLLPSEKPGEELPAPGPTLGFHHIGPDQRGAISADGSRVFFTSERHLYMRDTVAHKTIQIDAPEQGCLEQKTCGEGFVEAEFQFASNDGSRVFFKDTQKLTAGAGQYGNSGFGADLYVCEIHEDVCVLTDLAPSGAVMGEVIGASKDGSWVYFAANGALAPGAVSGACKNGAPSENLSPTASCDLYVEHYKAGVWGQPRVVAEVSAADQMDWALLLDGLVARVSPDGRWLAFMSQRSLTGYDNRDALSGRPDQEVYLYDAEHGRLTCASCDPSGARPQGVEYGNGSGVPLLGNQEFSYQWLAGSIPAWVRYQGQEAIYQPRYLSDSGRLFFDSWDALVSKDVNGAGDVYEYEPVGVGGCSSAADSGGVVFKPGGEVASGVVEGEGCVGLMSSGSSSEESAFLDASENGGDVFFISTARLSPLDSEGGRTVYDAHECTSVSPCIATPASSPPTCTTEASCLAAPSQQPSTFGLPASATFSGPGNLAPLPVVKVKTAAQLRAERLAKALRACHRIKKRSKRAKCEKQARRRYAVKASTNAKRAGNYRRAGR